MKTIINERIKRVRSEANMTLVEFGKKIGLTKSTVSRMEQNGYAVIPQNVQLICTAFNISEKWLTEGKGDMYTSDEEAILDKLAGMYDLSESQMIFAKQWLQLPATAKDAVVDYIVSVASALQEKKSKKNDVSESDTSKKNNINDLDSCHQTASPARENSAPPADNSRPENLTDEEWQLIQMARQEKRQASQTSSSTSSDIA